MQTALADAVHTSRRRRARVDSSAVEIPRAQPQHPVVDDGRRAKVQVVEGQVEEGLRRVRARLADEPRHQPRGEARAERVYVG